jgi:hypothetical protein
MTSPRAAGAAMVMACVRDGAKEAIINPIAAAAHPNENLCIIFSFYVRSEYLVVIICQRACLDGEFKRIVR